MKRYTISYDWTFDVVIDIDHTLCTDECLHEINNFWSGAKERLGRARGDITQAVLAMLALQMLRDTITELAAEDMWRTRAPEGWPNMDGSYGMTLVSLDYFEFDEDEIDIKSEVRDG